MNNPSGRVRFLHLSTGDTRGAYSGAYRLHRNLISHGHESVMLVGQKNTVDPTVIGPPPLIQKIRRFFERLQNLLLKFILGRNEQLSRIFKANLALVPLVCFRNIISRGDFDLIIVHYTADFLSSRQIWHIANTVKAPVVLYLMDMGPLTGSCHYAWECIGYQSDCNNCPKADWEIFQYLIRKAWLNKARLYRDHVRAVVYGSEQLAKQACSSSLTNKISGYKILMGIDSGLYCPNNRIEARRHFGFSDEELVIYFGAQNILDRRKGIQYLLESFRLLIPLLSKDEIASVTLFAVGDGVANLELPIEFRVKRVSYIAESTIFAMTYVAADLFVCPSVEDSGPMMVNEAIMSGTPVIAFDSGVSLDLVDNGKTGFRCEIANPQQMAEHLVSYLRMNSVEKLAMSKNCRELGLGKTSEFKQASDFVSLAESL